MGSLQASVGSFLSTGAGSGSRPCLTRPDSTLQPNPSKTKSMLKHNPSSRTQAKPKVVGGTWQQPPGRNCDSKRLQPASSHLREPLRRRLLTTAQKPGGSSSSRGKGKGFLTKVGSADFCPHAPSRSQSRSTLRWVAQEKEATKVAAKSDTSSEVLEMTEAVVEGVEGAARKVSSVGEITGEALEEIEKGEQIDSSTALKTVAFWVSAAAVFGLGIGVVEGSSKASEFFAGYLLEQSLSVDNLFVFVLVFNYFKVPLAYQPRVLTYGIAGAVLFRGVMIGAGLATIEAFEGIFLLFAAILLFSSYKLLTEGEDDDGDDLSNNSIVKFCQNLIPVSGSYDGDRFFTQVDGVRKATPLLLTLAVVELSDVFFAFDSIPAVFGVTRDSFIVFSSNIFAIQGLRSLFTVISTSMADLHYLQPAIATVLGFIGTKMIADVFGYHVPTEASLGVVATVLFTGVFLSLRFPKEENEKDGL